MPTKPFDAWLAGLPIGAAALAPWVYLRTAGDSTALPKTTFILVVAVAVLAVVGMRGVIERRWLLPHGLPHALAGAFLVAALIVAFNAPVQWYAWVGQDRRDVGMLLYAACVLLFMTASAVWRPIHLRRLVTALTVGALLLALYGLLQAAGVDPLGWPEAPSPVFGTLGNSNFFSAYLGLVIPLVAAQALEGGLARRLGLFAVAGVLCGAIVASQSIQGLFAAAAGLVVVAAVWLRTRSDAASRRALGALVIAAVLVGALGVFGLGRMGPLAPLMEIGTLDTRQWYWSAGLEMGKDHPVLGVGLGQYADYFRRYRPVEASQKLGSAETADAPHSVPIGMFAEGGALLALAYLAFVLAVGWRLVRALARVRGTESLLLGGFGGAWTAYQAQATVSIEMPSLVLAHFVLAAAVLALSGGAGRDVTFGSRRATRRLSGRAALVAAGLCIAGIALAWISTTPLRAVQLATRGRAYSEAGAHGAALPQFAAAIALTPTNPMLHAERARAFARAKRMELAFAAYRDALELAPMDLPYTLTAARLADMLGRTEAAELYQRVVLLEPASPEMLIEAATYFADHGGGALARDLAQRAHEIDPTLPEAQALLDRVG